jgi:Tol biopolymer transport system component
MNTSDRGIRLGSVAQFRVAVLLVTALAAVSPSTRGQLSPTTRVSVDSSGAEANDMTSMAWIAGDGRAVAFQSAATNLVPNDANGIWDVFVHDRTTGVTDCVSVDPNGVPGDLGGGDWSLPPSPPSISADGRFVVFLSYSTNLVAGQKGKRGQLYVRDRATGTTDFVSVDDSGTQGNADSQFGTISADGQFVAFQSTSTNLVAGDTNQHMDVFVRDRAAGSTERISVGASGTQGDDDSSHPLLSADGTTVAFGSLATNLVANDTNGRSDAFVCDLATNTLERISVDPSGVEGDSDSIPSSISADGRYVAIWSLATNLVPGDTNGASDCFVRDRATGITERVSVDSSGGESDDDSFGPFLSADGRFVAFVSCATNLVPSDANGTWDVFVHDRTTGSTTRVNLGVAGAEADDWSDLPTISADGSVVSFVSAATNLVTGDSNSGSDAFTYDLHHASWTNYGVGFPGTNGVPALTSRAAPVLGTSITLDVQNSSGQPTIGLLIAGFQRASLHTSRGGDLLVLPAYVLPITFSYGSNQFAWTIPTDPTLAGAILDLQAVEADPGAAKGVSFTAGLELVVGL